MLIICVGTTGSAGTTKHTERDQLPLKTKLVFGTHINHIPPITRNIYARATNPYGQAGTPKTKNNFPW